MKKAIMILTLFMLLVGCQNEGTNKVIESDESNDTKIINELKAQDFMDAFNELSPDVRDNVMKVVDNDFKMINGTLEESVFFLNALKDLVGDDVLTIVDDMTNDLNEEGFYAVDKKINGINLNITAADPSMINIEVGVAD